MTMVKGSGFVGLSSLTMLDLAFPDQDCECPARVIDALIHTLYGT
jgi:hypothetical protein